MRNKLHIIAFDIPCQPLYGGIIDVFYKIKSLYAQGIQISLHCFRYGHDKSLKDIAPYCAEIIEYPRLPFWKTLFSGKPHIVASRKSDALLANLLKDEAPILMEGIHSAYFINHPALENRKKIVWNHNIEHHYYQELAKASTNLFHKWYYQREAALLEKYLQTIGSADLIIGVSQKDTNWLLRCFKQAVYIPAFNQQAGIHILPGKGVYVLYHGNLSVEENIVAVEWLTANVWSKMNIPVIVAGKNPPESLKQLLNKYKHIELRANVTEEEMKRLQQEAHIHCLITFQDTGIKHKLLNALFIGRYILANDAMVQGTGLESLVHIENEAASMIHYIQNTMNIPYDVTQLEARRKILDTTFNNEVQAKRLIELIYP